MISRLEADMMAKRCDDARKKRTVAQTVVSAAELIEEACERETGRDGLATRIIDWCEKINWPRWKYIRARTDVPSTIAVGAHDITIFAPGGVTLCIEVKAKGNKLSKDQQAWAHEMGRLGHRVHTVWRWSDFITVVSAYTKPKPDNEYDKP